MKKSIIKILKATLVGLGSILPGISGGMIAAVFNIYEDLIIAMNDFTKRPIRAIINVWEYIVGVTVGLGLGIVVVAKIFNKYPIPITMLFIGFILGGIPRTINDTKFKKKQWYHYMITIFMALLMVGLLFLSFNNINTANGVSMYLIYILIGFFIAFPIVVPGVSGSTILMTLGLFGIMTGTLSNFITAIVTLNINEIGNTILPALAIIFSTFIGLIIFSKVIYYFIKNHKMGFNMGILGVLIISPVNIFYLLYESNNQMFTNIKIVTILISITLFILGILFAYRISKNNYNGGEISEI